MELGDFSIFAAVVEETWRQPGAFVFLLSYIDTRLFDLSFGVSTKQNKVFDKTRVKEVLGICLFCLMCFFSAVRVFFLVLCLVSHVLGVSSLFLVLCWGLWRSFPMAQ